VQQADGQAAEVKVGLKYEGDSDGYIEYFAFRNTSVAASQFAGVTHPSPSSGWRVVPGRLPGSSLPSRMLQQTLTTAPFGPSHTITDRLNALVVRQDAVVIYVLTEHRYVKGLTARRGYNPGLNAKSGDMNIPLMRSALAHLASAQKPV